MFIGEKKIYALCHDPTEEEKLKHLTEARFLQIAVVGLSFRNRL